MDGSDKSVSSIPKDTDENEQSYQEMGLNVLNLKKPTITKHFKSPTISTASKAQPSRKKILAERNDSLDNSLHNTPNLDSRTTSSTDFFGGFMEQNALLDDLASKPYDPLTNYLSPRPKFLRYKPNKRQEILFRTEKQVKEGKGGPLKPKKSVDLEGDLASSYKEANVKQEGEEIDESDDEFEEVYEKRKWGFKGVLEVLFWLGVLVVSTLCISDMNSPTPSHVVQAVAGVKDGYHMLQDHVYGFVKNIKSGKWFLARREEIQLGFVDIDGIGKDEIIEDAKIGEAECSNGLNELVDIGQGKVLDMVEDEEKGAVDGSGEGGEGERMENAEHEELGEIIEPVAGGIADACDPEIVSDQDVEVLEINSTTVSSVVDDFAEGNEVVYEPSKEEIFDGKMGGIDSIVHDKIEHEILINEAEATPKEKGITKLLDTELILKSVIGFSVFSLIIASLALGLHFGKKINATKDTCPVVESCPVVKPRLDATVIPDKCNSPFTNEQEEHNIDPVSFAISKPLIDSLEEDSKKIYESQAPSVELLGELVVKEMSSSLRSCGVKSSRMIESEVSNHSISMEKAIIDSKTNSVPVHLQPDFSEVSNMNLSSHSVEKKTMKEKEGENEEQAKKVVVTTPLRRSSRIRNRAISP